MDKIERWPMSFQVGDKVRVKDGTYANLTAVVVAVSDEPNVYRCEMPTGDGTRLVVLGGEQLEPLGDEPKPLDRVERGLLFVEREELTEKRDDLRIQLRRYGSKLEEIGRELRESLPSSRCLSDMDPADWSLPVDLEPVSCVPALWNDLVAACSRLKEINALLYPAEPWPKIAYK